MPRCPAVRLLFVAVSFLVAAVAFGAGREFPPLQPPVSVFDATVGAATASNGRTTVWLWVARGYVFGGIVDTAGKVIVPARPLLPYLAARAFGAAPGANGYLVVRRADNNYLARTFGDDGSLGPIGLAEVLPGTTMFTSMSLRPPDALLKLPTAQDAPRIASDGSRLFGAWLEGETAPSMVARLLDAPAVSANVPGFAVGNGGLPDVQVAYGGGVYLVIWFNGTGSLAMRFARDGSPLDAAPFVLPFGGAVASDGTDFLVASPTSVVRISSAGIVGQPRQILHEPSLIVDEHPALAFDGDHFVLGYAARTADPFCGCTNFSDIALIRLGRDGSPIDSAPLILKTAASNVSGVSVASRGGDAAVTWTDSNSDVHLALLQTGGATVSLTSSRVILHEAKVGPAAIALAAGGYLVAFSFANPPADAAGLMQWHLGAVRISADGTRGPLLSTRTGPPAHFDYLPAAPSIAATDSGDVTIALAESRLAGDVPRVVAYRLDELQPEPIAPRARAVRR